MAIPKLSDADVEKKLAELEGWSLDEGKLHKKFKFADFREAFGFMASIATAAEAMDHHPEWFNVYSRVEVWLTTHDASGITERDFKLAREMDRRA